MPYDITIKDVINNISDNYTINELKEMVKILKKYEDKEAIEVEVQESKMNNIEVNVLNFNIDWLEIKNLCRTTVNMQDSSIEPTSEWKRKLLIAEHSPLRYGSILIEIKNIPYAISTHLVRHHIGVEKWVSTSREDRTGIPRDMRTQMDAVNMKLELNIQSLINISRKRLCNQADPITRKIWQMVVDEVAKYDKDIAWACVPEGIHTSGCTESFGKCKSCNNFLDTLTKEELLDLQTRLTKYQEYTKTRTK